MAIHIMNTSEPFGLLLAGLPLEIIDLVLVAFLSGVGTQSSFKLLVYKLNIYSVCFTRKTKCQIGTLLAL